MTRRDLDYYAVVAATLPFACLAAVTGVVELVLGGDGERSLWMARPFLWAVDRRPRQRTDAGVNETPAASVPRAGAPLLVRYSRGYNPRMQTHESEWIKAVSAPAPFGKYFAADLEESETIIDRRCCLNEVDEGKTWYERVPPPSPWSAPPEGSTVFYEFSGLFTVGGSYARSWKRASTVLVILYDGDGRRHDVDRASEGVLWHRLVPPRRRSDRC